MILFRFTMSHFFPGSDLIYCQSSTEEQMDRFKVQDADEGFATIEEYGNDGSIALEEYGRRYTPANLEGAGSQVDSWRYTYVKRSLDILLASLMALVLAVPACLIAVAVIATSGWPLFYREERIGRFGHPFMIFKFRSMRASGSKPCAPTNEDHLTYRACKNKPDPRITFVGRFLRRWSLDELPQILNVLRGEMSLVGPRPIVAKETCFYDKLLPYYLAATPGLSGLWQVSGRSNIAYPERAQIDAAYVMEWSLRKDFRILMQTVPAVLKKTGAC
jgi:lipopolysaccharide/colanic/teichoic acid biosynthesis glycosyltransferase